MCKQSLLACNLSLWQCGTEKSTSPLEEKQHYTPGASPHCFDKLALYSLYKEVFLQSWAMFPSLAFSSTQGGLGCTETPLHLFCYLFSPSDYHQQCQKAPWAVIQPEWLVNAGWLYSTEVLGTLWPKFLKKLVSGKYLKPSSLMSLVIPTAFTQTW